VTPIIHTNFHVKPFKPFDRFQNNFEDSFHVIFQVFAKLLITETFRTCLKVYFNNRFLPSTGLSLGTFFFTSAFPFALSFPEVASVGSWAIEASTEVGVVRDAAAVQLTAAGAEGAVVNAAGEVRVGDNEADSERSNKENAD
jgi:hypothetical protein